MIMFDMGSMIASIYNVTLVWLSLKQNITIFPLQRKPPTNVNMHRLICIGHVHDSQFVYVFSNFVLVCLYSYSNYLPLYDENWCKWNFRKVVPYNYRRIMVYILLCED